jgi:hypothetical protein
VLSQISVRLPTLGDGSLLFIVVSLFYSDDGRATNPSTTQEAIQDIVANFENKSGEPVKAKL